VQPAFLEERDQLDLLDGLVFKEWQVILVFQDSQDQPDSLDNQDHKDCRVCMISTFILELAKTDVVLLVTM